MRILVLAYKDLLQILKDWKSGLFLLVMPILFTLFFGFVFGGSHNSKPDVDPRLPVGVINRDGGRLASNLERLLEGSEVIRPVVLDEREAEQVNQMVEDGDLAAVVTIPNGYTTQLLADQPLLLEVLVTTSQPAGQTTSKAIETVTGRLLGAVEAAHIAINAMESRDGSMDASTRQVNLEDNLAQAISAWEEPALTVVVEKATGEALQDQEAVSLSGFAQASSGMMVQFSIFGLITSAMVLVLERKSGTLQRLMSSPIRHMEVIAGHVLAMFLVIFTQQLILVLLGQFVFRVNYLRQPFAVLLMIATLSLWAASLGLLISAISRREDQVITLSLIAMFIFAAMGGAWFPLEVAGEAFAAIGHVLPTAWAMDGFQNILMRGLGLQSVLMPAGILLAYALGFFGVAIWRFRFE
ncbi:MAG TPA: ABC transporter permease [Anaerolineales bacterium]|nr:ABC transporter permease [Anaerolineales bacterium]